MPYTTFTLSNGLRVVHCHKDSDVVYMGYAIKAGSASEDPTEEGIAHFCEHMTFKGTKRLKPLGVITSIERYGGELNAYTAKEETVYYAAILRQHWLRAIDTLTDMVFNSTYAQEEIDKEVEVVCDEIESYKDSPAELIYDDFENIVFHGTPKGHNILGEAERVRAFTTADCQAFTRRWYRPGNMVFYIVGNVEAEKVWKWLSQAITATEPPAITPPQPQPTAAAADGRIFRRTDLQTHQTHVMMGTAVSTDVERWRVPLFLVNNMLGGPGMSALLNLQLRERRGLVYTVESVMTSYTDTLLWNTYFAADAADVSRCKRLVLSQLRQLAGKELSSRRLSMCKSQLKGQLILAEQSTENAAIDMAKQYLHRGTLRSLQALCTRIDAVTPQDVRTLAEQVMNPDRLWTLEFC